MKVNFQPHAAANLTRGKSPQDLWNRCMGGLQTFWGTDSFISSANIETPDHPVHNPAN